MQTQTQTRSALASLSQLQEDITRVHALLITAVGAERDMLYKWLCDLRERLANANGSR